MNKKLNKNNIESRVNRYIRKNMLLGGAQEVVVALSGGPDSVCLLEIMLFLKERYSYNISACHYNHRLRGKESDKDEEFVRNLCQNRGVELILGQRPKRTKLKSEADAREARYAFFKEVFEKKGGEGVVIATAHNMNDLAETFLMRVIRGSGLKGLSSILPQRDFFIRPLLQISKKEIELFLDRGGHKYRIDKTNLEDIYFRNQIRNNLIPDLQKFNPKILENLAETAVEISEDYKYIEKQAQDLFNLIVKKTKEGIIIDRKDWEKSNPQLRRHFLKVCFEYLGSATDVSRIHIKEIIKIIDNNLGKKTLPLPHSLRFELKGGKIYLYKNS